MEIVREREKASLGQRIWEFRRKAGLTQTEFAERLGVTAASVSRWEQGQIMPTPEKILAMAKVLDVDERAFWDSKSEEWAAEMKEIRRLVHEEFREHLSEAQAKPHGRISPAQKLLGHFMFEKARLTKRVRELESELASAPKAPTTSHAALLDLIGRLTEDEADYLGELARGLIDAREAESAPASDALELQKKARKR